MDNTSQADLFSNVRTQQVAPHSSGLPALQAFTCGRCHTLAVSLQDQMGGDLVVITPKNKPDYLIHVGVYKDGMVGDASGFFAAEQWANMWRYASHEIDGSFRRAGRAEVMAMIPERGCGDQEIAEAGALASALAAARHLDPRAWSVAPPPGGFDYNEGPPVDDRMVFEEALAKPERSFQPLVPSPSRAELASRAQMVGLGR